MDTLRLDTALTFDFDTLGAGVDNKVNSIEVIDLVVGNYNFILDLNLTDVLNLSECQTNADTLQML